MICPELSGATSPDDGGVDLRVCADSFVQQQCGQTAKNSAGNNFAGGSTSD
jgi:hypothetical protein